MKVTIYTLDGGSVEIKNMDNDTVLDMVTSLEEWPTAVMTFALNDAMTYIVRQNISRIDVEPSPDEGADS